MPNAYRGGMNNSGFDGALRRVRAGGARITRARRQLLEDLSTTTERVTAEELAERHDDVDLATIYRSLAEFERVGVIEHVHLGHGPAAYRWAGTGTIAAVCNGCGGVTDVGREELDPLVARLWDKYGIRLELGHFALSVRCRRCQ